VVENLSAVVMLLHILPSSSLFSLALSMVNSKAPSPPPLAAAASAACMLIENEMAKVLMITNGMILVREF